VSDSLTSSIEPESKQPALSERELLDLYESPDLFKSIVGGDAFNAIEEIDPDYVNKFIVSNYLSESHNIDNAQILENYESYAKSIGYSGIPANDANDIASDIRRTQRLSLQEVEPVTFTEGISGAAQRGVQNLSQAYSLMGISDPTYQSLIDGKLSEINQLDKVLESELNVKVKERARRQQESARQFIAGTLLLKSNEIKNFIDAQSKIESAKLSEGYKSFVDSGNIPTSPKAFGEFLVGFMTEQSVQQAPAALKTMASGLAGSPAVLATVFSESFHQERSFEMMQHLREDGVNFDDQESLNAALSNDELMSEAMLRGVSKAFPIAITSALSAYLPIKGKTALGKLGREVVTQAGLDSVGEVLGQYFATGEVDMREVMLEVLGGTTQSVAEFSTKIAANVAKSPINSILKNEDGSIKSRKEVVALSEYLPDDFAEEMSEVDPVTGNLVVEATRGNSEAYDSLVSIIRSVEESEVEVSPELKKLSDAVNELENINIEIQTEFEFTEEDVRDARLKEFKEREIVKGRPARITTQEKIANLKEKQEQSRRKAKDAANERFSKMESRYKEKVAKLQEEAKEAKEKDKQKWVDERADAKELSKQIQEFINVLPPDSRGKVTFARKMSKATTVDSRLKVLQGVVDRVNSLIDQDFVKGRKTLLRTVVKKATEGDAKAVSKRLGPNAEIVQKIGRIMKGSAEENEAAMLEELSQLSEDSEEGKVVSTLYDAFSNINTKEPKQLNASIALVEEIIKYGKDWRKQFQEKKLAELRKLRGDFFEEIDVVDPTKEEKALPEADVKRLIKKDDPTVAKKATRDYDLLSSPFIEGYDGPGPTDTSVPDYNSFHYVVSNPQQQELNAAIKSGAIDNLADQVAKEATTMMDDPAIAAGIGWYGRMRKRLGAIFGKDINIFTQLLGTTSAQTPVETNFRYSVDLYNRFKSGEFDSKIKKYLRLYGQMKAGTLGDLLLKDRVKNSKGVLYTPEIIKKSSGSALLRSAAEHYDLLPKQTSGKLYGTNSYPALKALAQVWFDEKLGKDKMTPKTPQFTMNLNGESLEATIDVWAARLLRRVIYKGQENARILPSQETAVSNPDFALGQLVFRRAAQKLNLNPDDLQALVWFGEKQIWDENGWTGAAGALKSSFDTPADVFYPVDGSTRSEADANLILDFLAAERIITRDINFPDAVQPTRQTENRKKYDKFLRQSVISDYLKSRGSGAIYESVSVESNRKRQVARSINRLSSYTGKVSYKSGTGKEPKGSLKVVKRGPVLNENRFSRIAKANKDGNKFGSSVDVFKPSDYKGYDLIITSSKPGESVTMSISPEGEVGSVTKSPGAAAQDVHAAFDMAISTGKVRFLNGFETILPDKYAGYGFTPVARLKFNPEFQPEGWSTATYSKYNGGQPDVVFMRFDGTIGSEYNPTGFPEVDTYEEGIRLATQEDVTAQAADLKEDDSTLTTLPSGEKAEITPGEPQAWKKVKPPKKSVKAYKLFRTDPNQPGKLFPLFVDAKTPVIVGEWVEAIIGEQAKSGKVKSEIGELAFRPGWHSGDIPVATHIGARTDAQKKAAAEVDAQRLEAYKKQGIDPKGAKDRAARAKINKEFPYPKGTTTPSVRPPNHVWAEVEVSNDVDWQTEANSRAERSKAGNIIARTAHIQDVLPKKGHYRYKTNSNMTGNWLISGEMKVVRVLSDNEVSQINKEAGVADLPRKEPGVTELQEPLLPEALKSQQELIPEFLSNIKDSKELTQEQKKLVEKIQEMGHGLEFSKSDGRVIEGRLHGSARRGPKGKSIITIADGLVSDQQIHSIGHELIHAQLSKLSPDLRSRVFSMVKELVNDKSFINAVKENWDLEKGSRGDLQAFEEILAEHGGRVLTRNKSTLGGAFNKVKDLFYKVSEIIIDLAEFAFRGKSSLKLDDLARAIIDLDVDRIESITADQEITVIAGYPESDIQLSFFKQKKKRKPDVLLSKQDLETKRNLAGVFGEWLEGADWYISTLDGIEQLIENLIRVPGTQYAGKLHDQITKPAFKAAEKFLTKQRTTREAAFDSFNKVLKDQGLNPEQIKDLFMGLRKPPNFEKGDSTGVYFESQPGYGVKEQPITKDQGIQLWMWRQDKTLQGSFDTMQWTDGVDAQLNSYIGEEGIALGKYMMSVYKKLGVEMNDVLFEVEGWKLPIIENYSPVSKHAKNAVLDIEEAMKDGIVKSTAKNNSMKLRVDEKAALDATRGALEVFDKHISEMNHYITHGEVAARMENLFGDDRVKRAIIQIYGPQRVRLIKHMIDNFTRGGIDYGRIDPFVSKLIRNVAVGKLAINFPSAVKQLGSVPAYANAMPAKEWGAGFLSFFKNASSNIKILLETDYIKNRITTTGDRDLRSIAESKSFQQAAMGAKNWRDRLMILTRLGDVGAIMAGGWPIYKKTYDEAIAAGKSIEEAKEMAEFEFGFVSDRSQQSSKPQNLSYFQSIGSFAKLFTMFMTSPIQYQRIVNSAIRSWRKGRVDLPTAMKTVAIYHIILPQIFTVMGSMGLGLFSDDEEKQEAWWRRQRYAAVLGNLNAFFLAGDALEALLGSIIKDEQFYDLSNPVVSELSSIVKSAANIDEEGNLSDLVGSMLLLLGGIPYDTISREFEAKYELLQGDDVYQNIWGISDYAAFETQKKKKKKKSTSSYYFN